MASRGVNKVILVGNCGGEPETRYMPNGNAVVNLTIATGESWKDKDTGQKVEKTEWHRVVFFNRLAEIVGEYVHKGSKLYIEGRLQTRSYEKEGQKHYATEIVASEMQMLDSRGAQGAAPTMDNNQQYAQNAAPQEAPASNQSTAVPQAPSNFDNFDDDIPF